MCVERSSLLTDINSPHTEHCKYYFYIFLIKKYRAFVVLGYYFTENCKCSGASLVG